jgi:hypothetical protein
MAIQYGLGEEAKNSVVQTNPIPWIQKKAKPSLWDR